MSELNECYNIGTFRLFVIKSAKGDSPSATNLFNGLISNKMIDTLNTERYSILASKTVVIKQSSTAINPGGIQEVGSGFR